MTNAWTPGSHAVQFYESEPFLHHTVAEFFTQNPEGGDALVLMSRPRTFEAVAGEMKSGNYGAGKEASGNILFIDAEEVLSRIIDGTTVDCERAAALFASVLSEARPSQPQGAVRLHGEIVDILCERGAHAMALEFEGLASVLHDMQPRLSILCGYGMERFRDDPEAARFRAVCRKHSHVLPAESFSSALRAQYRQSAMLRHRDLDRMLDVSLHLSARGSADALPAGPIYVIDDDACVRRALERLLDSPKGRVRTFESAEAFLAELGTLARGCVIADVELAGIDGFDLLHEMSLAHPSWPVILMSGLQHKDVESEALRRGARGFLHKPFESQNLIETLARALS